MKPANVKKCPYCYAYVAVKDARCRACGRRVGAADSTGWARKVLDWRAYLGAVVAVIMFMAFCWWAFLGR